MTLIPSSLLVIIALTVPYSSISARRVTPETLEAYLVSEGNTSKRKAAFVEADGYLAHSDRNWMQKTAFVEDDGEKHIVHTSQQRAYHPIGFTVWALQFALAACLLIWRLYGGSRMMCFQILLGLREAWFEAMTTSILPVAYDLMEDWGFSASMSGWPIGIAYFGLLFGAFHAKLLVPALRPEQLRVGFVATEVASAVCLLAFALTVSPPSQLLAFGFGAKMQLTSIIVLRALLGYLDAFQIIILQGTIWFQVTPDNEMVLWSIFLVCMRTLGMGLGPVLNSFAGWVAQSTTVEEEAMLVALAFASSNIALALLHWFILPASTETLQEMIEEKEQQNAESVSEPKDNEIILDGLDGSTKSKIWLAAAFFGVERAFAIAGIEAAIFLILETEFQWHTRSIGFAVGVVLMCSFPFSMAVRAVQYFSRISDIPIMMITSLFGAISILLFAPGISHSLPQGLGSDQLLVLLAIFVMFPSVYIAQGFADGLALRCCHGTSFSAENYRLVDLVFQDGFARTIAPPIVRFLIDSTGRGSYAVLQGILSLSGCSACYFVAQKIREGGCEKSACTKSKTLDADSDSAYEGCVRESSMYQEQDS